MDLLRHWRRSTFGAAAGVLLIPAAILVAALAVGFGGGGLGGLGAFAQAFGGPQAPAVAPASLKATARDANRLLARVGTPGRVGGGPRASARPRSDGSRGGRRLPQAPAPGTNAPTTNTPSRSPVTTPPTTAPAAPAATAAPAPAATVAPANGPVRQVTDVVSSVTDQVPGAGPPVGQAVDDTADAVDGLLKP